MHSPKVPDNEAERQQALVASGLLDNTSSGDFDRFTRLAQALFGCKISLFTVIDDQRQWFKSRQGIALKETPRDVSFCAHAVFNDKLLYVPDAMADERFAQNPLVTDEPAIRLYAGVPLHSVDGFPLGTLCIIDDMPRELNRLQLTLLQDLAALAETEIARCTLAKKTAQLQQEKEQHEQHRLRLAAFIETSRIATWEWNVQTGDVIFNERWAEMLGYDLYDLLPLSFETWHELVHPADRLRSERILQKHFSGELEYYQLECRMQHKEGHWVWILTQGKVISSTEHGQPRLIDRKSVV